MKDLLALSPETAQALATGRPVVALESTIITHGMPFPDNAAMAGDVEDIIRAHGATPATIAHRIAPFAHAAWIPHPTRLSGGSGGFPQPRPARPLRVRNPRGGV